eukprot:2624456-Amphidinium_carterae.2
MQKGAGELCRESPALFHRSSRVGQTWPRYASLVQVVHSVQTSGNHWRLPEPKTIPKTSPGDFASGAKVPTAPEQVH